MITLSPPRGRGWFFVLVGAGVLLLVTLIAMPLAALFVEQSDAMAGAQADLAHYRAEIAARPRLERARAALDRDDATLSTLLPGASDSLASANLQGLVKTLVEHRGGQLRSAQAVAAGTAGGLEKITVQFELTLPLGALEGATYDLESRSPYLYLDEIDVRPEIYADARSGAPSSVHVTWTVHGYRSAGSR